MDGRADRATCSSPCRQKAYRMRRPARPPKPERWCFGSCTGHATRPHSIGSQLLVVHLADVARRSGAYAGFYRRARAAWRRDHAQPRTADQIIRGWHDQPPPPDFVPTPGWDDQ